MRRYLVPIVLAAWCVCVAAGCSWTVGWLPALAVATLAQAAEHHDSYRHRRRRR